MRGNEDEPIEEDEEWLPPPRRSRRWGMMILGLVLLLGVTVGGFVVHGAVSRLTAPTPTPTAYAYPVSTPWLAPSIACDDAIHKIEQNQIAYVIIYREKDGGPAIPAKAVLLIEVLPRGIPYQGDPTQSVQTQLLAIDTPYPDHICLSPMLVVVKHINKTLPQSEQVKVGWHWE